MMVRKTHCDDTSREQQVAIYRQAKGSNIDTNPRDAGRHVQEQFVHHNAGRGGYGDSSYIDGVILRDDHEDDWTEAADSTLERRVYYCQNWRADVVALLAENGRVVERAWYEPYGTPHGLNPADFSGTSDDTNDHYLVPDGDADADDSFVYLDLFGVSAALSDMTGSSDPGDGEYGRPNGTVDSDDYFYFLDQYSVAVNLGRNVLSAGHDGATASHGAGNLRNRRGLAGYEWDPHVRRYHVRNRVLYPEIGRWTRRDPLGYVDGMGLYEYVRSSAVTSSDPSGTSQCAGSDCAVKGGPGQQSGAVGVGVWPPFDGQWWQCTRWLISCLSDPVVVGLQAQLNACTPGFVTRIGCTSTPGAGGFYDCNTRSISISSASRTRESVCQALAHELSHALDDCRVGGGCDFYRRKPNLPPQPTWPANVDCGLLARTEIRASSRSGQCCSGSGRWRLPGETYCECVFRNANASLAIVGCPKMIDQNRMEWCFDPAESPCANEAAACFSIR